MTRSRLFPATLLPLLAAAALAQAADPTPIGRLSRDDGREATIEGVVTARTADGGFVQDRGDGDPATSDALRVRFDAMPAVGERVRVQGRLADDGKSLQASELTPLGRGSLPKATVLRQPPADWTPYAGMRVKIATPLTVAGTDRLPKYGELTLNFGDRLRTPSDAARPGDALRAVAADNARRTLWLDDGSDAEQPPTPGFLPGAGVPRAGTRVRGVQGVVDLRHGMPLLLPTRTPRFDRDARPRAPHVAGDVRVASFNLENFFNGDGHGGGYPTPRGARTEAEHRTQQARLVATIRGLAPDIAALMELENDGFGPDSAVAQLVDALNAAGDGDWRFVSAADPGSDQIRIGMLYRASRVQPVGDAATLIDDLFGSRSRSRPPLAQSFRAGNGPVFTIVANHFKSKGCSGATGADADQHDGQSCWNAVRTVSARRLDAWLRTDPTHAGSDLTLIVGDLNAYTREDPVQALVDAGWRDAFAGHRDTPYSYVYAAQIGRLDHALLSPSLAARLAGAAEWHTNADEPESRGYQDRPDDRALWRSSDHDPLIVGLRLRTP
jgi:hypothetical protein